jgi:hypothetical protein
MWHVLMRETATAGAVSRVAQRAGRSIVVLAVAGGLAVPASAVAGSTARVSLSNGGLEVHGNSSKPSLSADGRYVGFSSEAPDVVAGDTNGTGDVFVRDRVGGKTVRISVSSSGVQGDRASGNPMVSGGGRYIAFESWAATLVPGDTNGTFDVFVRATATRMRTASTTRTRQSPPRASACRATASKPTMLPLILRSPTGGTSSLRRRPRTWWPTTRTTCGTSSCATARPPRPSD